MDSQIVIEHTRRWILDVVIGLNLCPFARKAFDGGLIRFVVTEVSTPDALAAELVKELHRLDETPTDEVETTLLIHPNALADFLDYNDFVADAEELIAGEGLEGVIQIAGFHPQYQFAGTQPDDAENYTNRSPFPMLHLLREDSITAVNDSPEKLEDIPRRNVELLRLMGRQKMLELLGRVQG
ncbi:MAG: DUF1415 domain-containing protein [Gemmataceae bacterium]|nr:DUF1415 domain-containing protein [Gemmataceae bacterium]